MVTGHKDKKGDFHPHSSGGKTGVSENDLKISVTGNNDVIKVQPKPTSGMKGNREDGLLTDKQRKEIRETIEKNRPLREIELWDNASHLKRIQILNYLNIDEKSKNGKKFINESYSELPEHIRIELSKMNGDKFGYYPNRYDNPLGNDSGAEYQHGDYKTTYAVGNVYHQIPLNSGKMNAGTSYSHKQGEFCLICK